MPFLSMPGHDTSSLAPHRLDRPCRVLEFPPRRWAVIVGLWPKHVIASDPVIDHDKKDEATESKRE